MDAIPAVAIGGNSLGEENLIGSSVLRLYYPSLDTL